MATTVEWRDMGPESLLLASYFSRYAESGHSKAQTLVTHLAASCIQAQLHGLFAVAILAFKGNVKSLSSLGLI